MELVLQHGGYRPRAHKQLSLCLVSMALQPQSLHWLAPTGMQAQRHRAAWTSSLMDTPADLVIPLPLRGACLSGVRGGTARLQGERVFRPVHLHLAGCSVSCFLSQAESPPACSNLSLESSAGSGKVSECVIEPSQGTPGGRGWGDKESSGFTLQSCSQNRGLLRDRSLQAPSVHHQATNCTGLEMMCSQMQSQWKGFHPGKPISPSLPLVLLLWGWSRAASSPLCTWTFRTPQVL